MALIQKLLFPDPALSDCLELYFRGAKDAVRIQKDAERTFLAISPGTTLTTDTFFNSLSLSPWSAATHLKTVAVELKFSGSCEITVCWLKNSELSELSALEETILQTEHAQNCLWRSRSFDLALLKEGLLFVRIKASSEVVLIDLNYVTEQAPTRPVKLGIVVTTFNRQEQTLGAIHRLSESINRLPIEERNQYKILVIDNGRNLNFGSTDICEVIPNTNLGGTGGFMKGLLEFKSRGTFTHCLFMDDDASCFFESVARTKRFYEYANGHKLAVSGTMLLNEPSYMQSELTAYFRRLCRPRLGDIDARSRLTLILDDTASGLLIKKKPIPSEHDVRYNYGGWWFFAFPIDDVEIYSFPFFVRGDDVFFSVHNNFRVFALSGVASWQESFQTKSAPFIRYLDCRGHLVQNMLLPGRNIVMKLIDCVWTIHHFSTRQLLAGQYSYGRATLAALKDVLKGPRFWFSNLDFDTHLKFISARLKSSQSRDPIHNPVELFSLFVQLAMASACLIIAFPLLLISYNRTLTRLTNDSLWRKLLR
jgi:GT2 family glycosyltransferase